MAYEVEFTADFEAWWNTLTEDEQESVAFSVKLLEELGPALHRPHADTLHGSKYPNMRELRVQHRGRPFRVLYAFDPRRVALLLLGGDKTGNARWTVAAIIKAEALYEEHLKSLLKE